MSLCLRLRFLVVLLAIAQCLIVCNASTVLWLRSISSDLLGNAFRRRSSSESSEDLKVMVDKVVYVTGSLGGIGRALCKKFHAQGAQLIMQSRPWKERMLAQFVEEELGDDSNRAHRLQLMDFTDLDDITEYAKQLRSSYRRELPTDASDNCTTSSFDISKGSGGVDVLVHNAGLMDSRASLRDIYRVNCIAPFALTLVHLPFMIAADKRDAAVVFVTSSSHLRAKKYSMGDLARSLSDSQCVPHFELPLGSNRLVKWHAMLQHHMQVLRHRKKVLDAYAQSKYNMILLGTALEALVRPPPLPVQDQWRCSFFHAHPGLVDTPMLRRFLGNWWQPLRNWLLLTPAAGAENILRFQQITNEEIDEYRRSFTESTKKKSQSSASRWFYPQQRTADEASTTSAAVVTASPPKMRQRVYWSKCFPPIYLAKGKICPRFTHRSLFINRNMHLILQMRCCLQEAVSSLPAALVDEILFSVEAIEQSLETTPSSSRSVALHQLKMILASH